MNIVYRYFHQTKDVASTENWNVSKVKNSTAAIYEDGPVNSLRRSMFIDFER